MRFSVDTYSKQYLDGMAALYNAETDSEPHITPLTPERFVELVESRKGIATALVSHVMTRSYEMGARFASVTTQLWNAPAYATYTRLGFRPQRIVMGRSLELGREVVR